MNKKSYMNKKNILSESFIDNLLKALVPNLQKKATARFLKKNARKLKKYEDEMKKNVSHLNVIKSKLEKDFELELGKKVKFDDLSIEDILSIYK